MTSGPSMRAPFLDVAAAALLAATAAPRKALFLDRDGVVNIDHGHVHSPAQTNWVDGIFELVQAATASGFICIVVTNQAGIARGLYTESEFNQYTRWQHGEFAARGSPLLATFHCPHHPEFDSFGNGRPCQCRKPAPGMILDALRMFDVDPAASLLLGDKTSDIEAAHSAGIGRAYRVARGSGRLPGFNALQSEAQSR